MTLHLLSVLQPSRIQRTPGWTACSHGINQIPMGKEARTTRMGPGRAEICDLITTSELIAQLSTAVKLHLQLLPLIYRKERISRHFPASLCLQSLHIIKVGACSLFYLSFHHTVQRNTLGFGGCRQKQALLCLWLPETLHVSGGRRASSRPCPRESQGFRFLSCRKGYLQLPRQPMHQRPFLP